MNATLTIDDRRRTRPAGPGTDPQRSGRAGTACRGPSVGPAARWQLAQLPAFAPLLEELELAGWSSPRRFPAGHFHDWLLLGNGQVLVAVGHAHSAPLGDPVESALVAQAAWSTIRAHAVHTDDAGTLLSLAARSLWPIAVDGPRVAAAVAIVDTIGGRASLAAAGDALAWRIRAATTEHLTAAQPPLGASTDCSYQSHELELSLRERLLLVADDPATRPERLLATLPGSFAAHDAESHRRMSAADVITLARTHYDPHLDTTTSLAAIRRR